MTVGQRCMCSIIDLPNVLVCAGGKIMRLEAQP